MLPQDYFWGYAFVAIFLLVGVLFAFIAIMMSRVLGPRSTGGDKLRSYESGEVPIGPAWVQFPVHYYVFALLFVVFDVEAIFFLIWANSFRRLGLAGLVEMAVFALVLLGGLVYAWKKGVLKWT